MTDLTSSERLVINQLFDHGIFTSTVTPKMTNKMTDAIKSVKRPLVQQHINTYLKQLVGSGPDNYQNNFLFFIGSNQLDEDHVHVLLATLKAVINLPELKGRDADRAVATQSIMRQVHSEVPNLSEKLIYKMITDLFVTRLELFKPDIPENLSGEETQEVKEYWDVSPDFNYIAQCIVNYLMAQKDTPKLTAVQRVNRALMIKRYISAKTDPGLWPTLVSNKNDVAEQWAQLQRFDLECGNDYALLLDRTHQPSSARPFVLAIAVAHSLGAGIPAAHLNQRIKQINHTVLPDHVVAPGLVSQALEDNALAYERGGFVIPSPLVKRFSAQKTE